MDNRDSTLVEPYDDVEEEGSSPAEESPYKLPKQKPRKTRKSIDKSNGTPSSHIKRQDKLT